MIQKMTIKMTITHKELQHVRIHINYIKTLIIFFLNILDI